MGWVDDLRCIEMWVSNVGLEVCYIDVMGMEFEGFGYDDEDKLGFWYILFGKENFMFFLC